MLTVSKINSLKPIHKNYKITDGDGLRLHVKTNGTRAWLYDYRSPVDRKRKTLSLGTFDDVSLADARALKNQAKLQLREGIDPCIQKKVLKKNKQGEALNSFKVIALEWFENCKHKKVESTNRKILRLLERNLFPYLKDRPIQEITPAELLEVLKRIEDRGAIDTAHLAKQYSGQIFQFAIATSRTERDITANLKHALKTPIKSHFSAITDPKELGKLLAAIKCYQGATSIVKAALELSPLLVLRPGELRHLEWQEINWKETRIELPAKKMKMKDDHIVPLSSQALNILLELKRHTGDGKYVFPSARGASRPMSENALRVALRALGFSNEEMTAHGFRATFRTLADEILEMPVAWIEHQLAHKVKDSNGTAYNRTKHLLQRREMMQKWADYLDGLRAT